MAEEDDDTAPLPVLPAEVLQEIFHRLPTASSLGRTAAACSSFRSIVSAQRFIRHFHSLHRAPPPLLGAFSCASGRGGGSSFHPAQPPHASASAAGALVRSADFSFSFLPPPAAWFVRDHRDGRFLLDRAPSLSDTLFTDIAVCDPLSRRYVLLPPIPADLAAAVKDPLPLLGRQRTCDPFLAPSGEDEQDTVSFTVIWMARCPRKIVAFAFSSRGCQWRALASPDCFVWSMRRSPLGLDVYSMWNKRHYAHGCFYWVNCAAHQWLVLDTRAMEFSVADVPSPSNFWEEHVAVVEAGDGTVGVFAHDFHNNGNANIYYFMIVHSEGDGSRQWHLERVISLPWGPAKHYCIRDASKGCLILEAYQDSPSLASKYKKDVELFALHVQTFNLERVCRTKSAGGGCLPYFGFPPLLSPPTV